MAKNKTSIQLPCAAFIDGVLRGMAATGSVFRPEKISVKVDDSIIKSSYRPASEDADNIRRYFERAIGRVEQEDVIKGIKHEAHK